jgi:acyl-coenzyme A thioesterase PaaI-like protein
VDGYAGSLGVRERKASDGRSQLDFAADDGHLNPAGSAVRSATDDSDVPATSQLTITYLRPAAPGLLNITAEVRKRGQHLTICEADIEQDGQSVVHALATFALKHT